jgi:hypothetical protein
MCFFLVEGEFTLNCSFSVGVSSIFHYFIAELIWAIRNLVLSRVVIFQLNFIHAMRTVIFSGCAYPDPDVHRVNASVLWFSAMI